MYDVSDQYLDSMNQLVRDVSSMKIIFSFDDGDVTFTDSDIVKFTESKTAHLVAGELPTIETSIELKNLEGLFDPNNTDYSDNYHDQIVEGVKVTYYYGLKIPNVKPYGYDADESDVYEPVYGIEDSGVAQYKYYTDEGYDTIPAEAYGYVDGYTTEWIKGGEVYTDGDLSYDESAVSVTITAYDYLSLMETEVYYSFSGTTTLAEIATNVIGLTDYPEDDDGNKKIVLDSILSDFSTSISVAGYSTDATSAKTWLQDIAYAGCVKMYVDRDGYLHLDNDPETYSASQYELTLANQSENPTHAKYQLPATLTIESSSDYVADVEVTIGGGGEDLTISGNDYIVTTTACEALRDRLVDDFLPYRNEADLSYRGEPALDILDNITFDSDFANGLTGTIIESGIEFDGTLSGTLVIRYNLGNNTPTSVEVTGSDNFYYPYLANTPNSTYQTLTCVTDNSLPTYQWYYYSSGSWVAITDETNSTLIVNYSDAYDFDNGAKFKCIVSESLGATATITNIYSTISENASYQGVVVGTSTDDIENAITSPVCGDSCLLDNTSDTEATVYGQTYLYDGYEWQVTTDSAYIALSYNDALLLSNSSGESTETATTVTDALTENADFTASVTKSVALTTDISTMSYSTRYDTTFSSNPTVTLTLTNITDYTVSWAIAGASWATTDDLVRTVDNTSLTSDTVSIIATVTSNGVEYSDSVNITRTYTVEESAHLGILDSEPTEESVGFAFIEGDSYVLETYVSDEYVYTPYVYSDGAWITITDDNGDVDSSYYSVLMNSATSILSEGKNVSATSSAIYGYFQNLVATNAFIENLAAQNILLQDDGSIRSDYYNQDSSINEDSDAEYGFLC